MLNIIAAIVDHSATRILLTVFGLGVTLVFGAFAIILLITNAAPGESLFAFLVGLGGCLGLVGWWSRLFMSSGGLAKRGRLRKAIVFCLSAGILASVAGTSMFPRHTPGQVVLWLMAGVGVLLLIGSLGSGSNNSFKPNPLRGRLNSGVRAHCKIHGSGDKVTNDLTQSQSDMRSAYCSGGCGVLASSLAWLAAAIAALQTSPTQAVWVLFLGGAAIHPAATVLCKLFGASGKHTKGNSLGALAFASLFWLIFSLPLAYVVSLHRIEWFFPAMLLVIGGRYLTFHTLFGLRIYWILGLALAAAGYWLGRSLADPTISAFTGAAVEALFAAYILVVNRREMRPNTSFKPNLLRRSA